MTYKDFVGLHSVQNFVVNPTNYGEQYKMFQFLKLRTCDELTEFSDKIKKYNNTDLYDLLPMIKVIIEDGSYSKS